MAAGFTHPKLDRKSDVLDEIIQANREGRLWSSVPRDLILAIACQKTRPVAQFQDAVLGQYQIAQRKKRRTFVEDLRYIGREVFSLEFMTNKLGMSVRRKGPSEKVSTVMDSADHTFGARDIRYFGANSTEVPNERRPDDAVSVDCAGEEEFETEPRAVTLGTDSQKTVQTPMDLSECEEEQQGTSTETVQLALDPGCEVQSSLECNEEDPVARQSPARTDKVQLALDPGYAAQLPREFSEEVAHESEKPVLSLRNLTVAEVGPNMVWTPYGLSIGRGRPATENQSQPRSRSKSRDQVGNLACAEEPGSKHRCFSRCPIPDCMRARNLRRHVMAMHLPTRFREEHLDEPAWHQRRVRALKWLASRTTGSDSLESLRRWVDESGRIPMDTTVSERDDRWLSRMCRKEGWSCPPRPSLVPVNSLALLAHWRVLATVLVALSKEQRHEFYKLDGAGVEEQENRAPAVRPTSTQTTRSSMRTTSRVRPDNRVPVASGVEEQENRAPAVRPTSTQTTRSSMRTTSRVRPDNRVPVASGVEEQENRAPAARPTSTQTTRSSMRTTSRVRPDNRVPVARATSAPATQSSMRTSSSRVRPEEQVAASITVHLGQTTSTGMHTVSGRTVSMAAARTTEDQSERRVFKVSEVQLRERTTISSMTEAVGGVDSHFHVDRLILRLMKRGQSVSIEDAPAVLVGRKPRVPLTVTGGVKVYCDPETYPGIISNAEGFKVAIGFHPRHAGKFTDESFSKMRELLRDPGVTALGEVGLDWTEPQSTWGVQREVLMRTLELSCPDRVLVIHMRDHTPYGTYVHGEIMDVLKAGVAPTQRIHFHCFTGISAHAVQAMRTFPQASFGLAGSVAKFDNLQKEAVRAISSSQLLLETDSPYLRVHDRDDLNTPAYLGEIAEVVATIRGEPILEVLRYSSRNARALYRL